MLICSNLSTERQQHSTCVRQTRKLYSQVKQLGHELGQVKHEKEQVLEYLKDAKWEKLLMDV